MELLKSWTTDHPVVMALVRVVCVVVVQFALLVVGIWWERRVLAFMQDRLGPNRVATITWSRTSRLVPGFLKGKKQGFAGLFQPLMDGLKLFMKEDVTPTAIDRAIYFIAPAIAMFPAFALTATVVWGPKEWIWQYFTPIADINVAILYLFAVSSLGVYGIVLAGYSSNNKYSLLGGLRSSAQLISYELAMSMALASMVLLTGSLRMTQMVEAQQGPLWGSVPFLQNWFVLTPFGAVAAVVFLICMVAETNRAPFDLPEAENELIAGYHTEYSSMKFAAFFMGEYAAMVAYGMIFATIFLGGFNAVPVNWHYLAQYSPIFGVLGNLNVWFAPLLFIGKVVAVFTAFIWIRATLPRLRYDQLMSLGWRSLLPLAVTNFLVVALWIVCTEVYGKAIGWLSVLAAVAVIFVTFYGLARAARKSGYALEKREVLLVDPGKASL
jgi:NADH-quinone oxidoreductase subunit H